MASIRFTAACMGLTGNFSMLSDFFGFSTGAIPVFPTFTVPTSVSLLNQVRLLSGTHFHLNVIRVGSESFGAAQNSILDGATLMLRQIYAQGNLGVGRVQHFQIPTAEADGKETIMEDDDAEDLTEDWTVHDLGIDMFVTNFAVDKDGFSQTGISGQGGSCDKDEQGFTGSVVSIVKSSPILTGINIAHELGHYLGLPHIFTDDPKKAQALIALSTNDPAVSIITRNVMYPLINANDQTLLDPDQFEQMKQHCFVGIGCFPV